MNYSLRLHLHSAEREDNLIIAQRDCPVSSALYLLRQDKKTGHKMQRWKETENSNLNTWWYREIQKRGEEIEKLQDKLRSRNLNISHLNHLLQNRDSSIDRLNAKLPIDEQLWQCNTCNEFNGMDNGCMDEDYDICDSCYSGESS